MTLPRPRAPHSYRCLQAGGVCGRLEIVHEGPPPPTVRDQYGTTWLRTGDEPIYYRVSCVDAFFISN